MNTKNETEKAENKTAIKTKTAKAKTAKAKNVKTAKVEVKTRRPGSGRTKGAVSFATVTLAELNRLMQPAATVVASRKWLEGLNASCQPIEALPGVLKALASPVEMKIHDLSAPAETESVLTGMEQAVAQPA